MQVQCWVVGICPLNVEPVLHLRWKPSVLDHRLDISSAMTPSRMSVGSTRFDISTIYPSLFSLSAQTYNSGRILYYNSSCRPEGSPGHLGEEDLGVVTRISGTKDRSAAGPFDLIELSISFKIFLARYLVESCSIPPDNQRCSSLLHHSRLYHLTPCASYSTH